MRLLNKTGFLGMMVALLITLSACGNSSSAGGEGDGSNYPEKEIKIVVPFAAGGAATTTARLIAQNMEEHVGQEIVVENREGGGGTAGQQAVASAEPNGYTLLLATNSVITNPIFSKTGYTHEDFAPIGQVVSDASYLYIPEDAPYDDYESFVSYAKENPGEVTIGTSGAQASDTFAAKDLIEAEGLDAQTVPYDGAARAVSSAAGGHDDAAMSSFSETEGQVQEGNLKPVLIFSEDSSEEYPDIPTTADIGYEEITDESWRGLVAPEGTDEEILNYLTDALEKAFNEEDFQKAMENQGMVTRFRNGEELTELMNKQYEQYNGE
ncbi:tripartite tricarboxylate transporter substrate binding protein [Halobacillus shinanisalinarum]|uniref:Tripartite tricarboxylate transporter substrate binding protein n=1 Tax=Halobacillus shinanisalinarum TaxID=2932258 RepID=A0ABY4GUQ9_9BACI|nr:tripartite tricarboxylate transporter substrate binding protein [Halobacillus shinanisalinarum]UOQ91902.1 tripartite tricarboxylate transporter substrate binding protein [Halobacillus shinanisalinarum]